MCEGVIASPRPTCNRFRVQTKATINVQAVNQPLRSLEFIAVIKIQAQRYAQNCLLFLAKVRIKSKYRPNVNVGGTDVIEGV